MQVQRYSTGTEVQHVRRYSYQVRGPVLRRTRGVSPATSTSYFVLVQHYGDTERYEHEYSCNRSVFLSDPVDLLSIRPLLCSWSATRTVPHPYASMQSCLRVPLVQAYSTRALNDSCSVLVRVQHSWNKTVQYLVLVQCSVVYSYVLRISLQAVVMASSCIPSNPSFASCSSQKQKTHRGAQNFENIVQGHAHTTKIRLPVLKFQI